VVRRNNTDESGLNVVGTLGIFVGRRLTVRTDAPGVQLYTQYYRWWSIGATQVCKVKQSMVNGKGLSRNAALSDSSTWQRRRNEQVSGILRWQCIILRPGEPDYKHRVEYDLQYQNGSATETILSRERFRGRQYDSIAEMWECQGVFSDGDARCLLGMIEQPLLRKLSGQP
jgi:hypothetical protein